MNSYTENDNTYWNLVTFTTNLITFILALAMYVYGVIIYYLVGGWISLMVMNYIYGIYVGALSIIIALYSLKQLNILSKPFMVLGNDIVNFSSALFIAPEYFISTFAMIYESKNELCLKPVFDSDRRRLWVYSYGLIVYILAILSVIVNYVARTVTNIRVDHTSPYLNTYVPIDISNVETCMSDMNKKTKTVPYNNSELFDQKESIEIEKNNFYKIPED